MTFTFVGFLIAVAPLMVLVTLLLAKKYPGESAIRRLRNLIERLGHGLGSDREISMSALSGPVMVRGGRLIACALAGRAPPVHASNPT